MKVLTWEMLEREPGLVTEPVALTVGVFDGLHIGHQRLIESIRSAGPGTVPLVLTFTRSPAAVLAHASVPGRILSLPQKLRKLERLGVERVVLIDFSRDFSTLSGRDFLEKLETFFHIRKFVVGYNFSFGRNRDTDVDALREMLADTGIELEVVEPTIYLDQAVSSSRIRKEISEGKLQQVHSMLGEEYSLDLAGIPELKTENGRIETPRSGIFQIIPPPGDYLVSLVTSQGQVSGQAAVTENAIRWKPILGNEVKELVFMDRLEIRRTECH